MALDLEPTFSIVIPTYNEECVIVDTLTALLSQDYHNFEVIVVDDSDDNTVSLISSIDDPRVKLIKPLVREGRSAARNKGILSAKGSIVVLLNADVVLHPQFLSRLLTHYNSGYESVTCLSTVINTQSVFARYVDLWVKRELDIGEYEKRKLTNKNIYWSEGFSALREKILQTDLFPETYSLPIEAGEDVYFVDQLRNNGVNGIIDLDLHADHIAPSSLSEFWSIRIGRGRGTPQVRYFIDRWSINKIIFMVSLKLIYNLFSILLIFPLIIYGIKVARYSDRNIFIEVINMASLRALELLTYSLGEVESLKDIIMESNKKHES